MVKHSGASCAESVMGDIMKCVLCPTMGAVMQTRSRLFEDLARVASGAVSTANSMREEVEELIQQRLERMLNRMNVAPREEFDAVRDMAAKARAEQEKLEKRVAALEAQLVTKMKKAARSGSPKSAPLRPKAGKT